MTVKSDTGDAAEAKGTEAPEGAPVDKDDAGKAARPRRIVRSRSTSVAAEGEAPVSAGDAPVSAGDAPVSAGGPAAEATPESKGEAAARPPRHDLRAPARPAGAPSRPRPEGMPQRPPRPGALPGRPRPEGMPQRPPRPGALPSERGFDPDRPRGPRGPRREGGPRADRPRFEGRPGEARPSGEGRPRAEAKAIGAEGAAQKPAATAKPAQKPAAPAAKPAAPPAKPAAPPPKPSLASAPKANKPVFVPLLRAGQQPASAKPTALTPKEALAARTKAHAAHAAKAQPKHEDAAPKSDGTAASQEFSAEALAAGWENAKTFVSEAGEAAAALVDAWLAKQNAAAIVAIAEAEAGDVVASARKAARRALAVLKSRGVAIPERPKPVKAEERGETLEATFLPADSNGTWSVALTSRDASGRYRIAEVIGREPAGVIHAGGGWLSGSQLKEGRARAQNSVGMAPVPVPVAWARARVLGALALNGKSGQVVPLGYESCRELFEVPGEGAPEHPVADLEAKVTSELAAERAKESASLHEESEFMGWLPDRRAMDEMMQNVGTRLGPQGTQDQEAVNNALREEIDASTDRYFSPEVREQLAARMRDSAISVRARKGDERALDVLAVARAVKEAGLITSPPREIPFLVVFFQKALSVLAQAGGGRLRVPMPAGARPASPAPQPPAEGEGAPAENT